MPRCCRDNLLRGTVVAHANSRFTGSTGMIGRMRPDRSLTPWPGLRQTWWVYAAAVALLTLYVLALMMRIRCRVAGHCGGPGARLLNLDALGGLPRLTTTGLFLVVAVVALRAARRRSGTAARWWAA